MNKRHIADKEFARAASVCPNVFSVSIDKPCKECGKVIMIPADSGVCMICAGAVADNKEITRLREEITRLRKQYVNGSDLTR